MDNPSIRAMMMRASALREAGRVAEAIVAYQTLLAADPSLAESWYNLAFLQRQAGHHEAALAGYAEALRRGASSPEEIHLNRAAILTDHLNRHDDAADELRMALARNPAFIPALLNLGNLEEDAGRRAAARAAYRSVTAIDPHHALALARLVDVEEPARQVALAREMRAALDRPGATAADRIDLLFGLGKLHDRMAEHGAAFDSFVAANRENRRSAGAAGSYDRAAQERFVDRLAAVFATPVEQSDAAPVAPPLFICGMFRSGSTLTERILARHPLVTAGGELPIIPALVAGPLRPYPDRCAALSVDDIDRLRQNYLAGLAGRRLTGAIVTDKRPDNFLHIGLIKTLFPTAKIIHSRRDMLDNLLSIYFLQLDPRMAYAHDLLDAAHWMGQYRRLMTHWQRLYPGDIHDLDYDTLVHEPRPTIEALLRFCGLNWDERVMSFDTGAGAVKTASVWQVREPLYQHSSGRWRHYERQLSSLRSAIDALVNPLG